MPSSSSFTENNDKKLRSNGVFATKTKKALLMFFVLAGAFVVLSLTRSNTTPSNVEGASFVSSFAASNINSSSHSSCYPKIGLRPVKSREELPKLLEEHKLKSGIEIGVKQGSFAKYILDRWKSCEKYHLVDLWAQQENYKDIANVENATSTNSVFYRILYNLQRTVPVMYVQEALFVQLTIFRWIFSKIYFVFNRRYW